MLLRHSLHRRTYCRLGQRSFSCARRCERVDNAGIVCGFGEDPMLKKYLMPVDEQKRQEAFQTGVAHWNNHFGQSQQFLMASRALSPVHIIPLADCLHRAFPRVKRCPTWLRRRASSASVRKRQVHFVPHLDSNERTNRYKRPLWHTARSVVYAVITIFGVTDRSFHFRQAKAWSKSMANLFTYSNPRFSASRSAPSILPAHRTGSPKVPVCYRSTSPS